MAQKTVHLVDVSPYIFRAYFSIPPDMKAPDGSPVNAVYGFAHFLLRLLKSEAVSHIALAYDKSLNTSFRNDFYPPYKAQRELPPPELEAQLERCLQIGQALGMATFINERYEADDLVATLCRQLEPGGHNIVIVTSDKDLAQLVTDRVSLLDFAREERYGPSEVHAKFGVRPQQIADYLGLAGDSVDNIPGVPGVGKKTAAALLAAFDDLEAIYSGLETVPTLTIRGAKKLPARLEEHREQAFLSRRLATVAFDAPAQAQVEELRYDGADRGHVERLATELGLEGFRDRIDQWRETGS